MPTWKLTSYCLVMVILLTVATGCGAATSLRGEYDLVEPGYLTVGADAAYPPHTFVDPVSKEIVGLDVDLSKEIGRRLGLEAKFVTIDWNGIIPALQAGRFDLISAEMHITPEREEVVDFSDVVLTGGHVIVVRSDSTSVSGPEDLAGKTVLVPIGTTEEDLAREYTSEVLAFPLLSECFRQLQLGRGDAVIVELTVASEYILRSDNALKVVSSPISETKSAFAFRKDPKSSNLRIAINQALQEMKADGTYDEIISKWIAQTHN